MFGAAPPNRHDTVAALVRCDNTSRSPIPGSSEGSAVAIPTCTTAPPERSRGVVSTCPQSRAAGGGPEVGGVARRANQGRRAVLSEGDPAEVKHAGTELGVGNPGHHRAAQQARGHPAGGVLAPPLPDRVVVDPAVCAARAERFGVGPPGRPTGSKIRKVDRPSARQDTYGGMVQPNTQYPHHLGGRCDRRAAQRHKAEPPDPHHPSQAASHGIVKFGDRECTYTQPAGAMLLFHLE